MKKTCCALIFILLLISNLAAQDSYFGKNKVRYKNFEWNYIQTRHFDIHFYEDAYPTAKFTATVLESSYVEITKELNYVLQNRVPVFVYNSHNDFQQTNIISSLIPEGVGGFTEAFKNRIVIPFAGSYEEFRHVLHHELTHAVVYDLIYGGNLSSLISKRRFFSLPLWFAEGYAEYSSRHGWDYFADMFIRDATVNNYLTPPMYLGGFLAYKQGQAMVKYIADKYGEEKLGEILKKGKVMLKMDRVIKEILGVTEKELFEDFSKEMKRRYWPDIAERKEAKEIAKQLTKARKDGSYFNEKPSFHPDGRRIALFTDKSDYTEIVMISARDGKERKSLVKGERSGDLESLHSFVSGITFSPDGEQFCFVAKSNGDPTLMFYNLDKNKIYKKKSFNFYNIVSPAWSPDGSMIAFAALDGYKRDIFVYDIENDSVEQITDDRYDDNNPSWLAESNEFVFASDRPHPKSQMPAWNNHIYVDETAYLPGDFNYGYYNLFRVKLDEKVVSPLDVGMGQNTVPAVSPDGRKVAFISNRNGIDNIYIAYLDSTKSYPLTDILTGVRSISWSPNGKKIAFSAFSNGAFDIFVLSDLIPQGENGELLATNYMKGKFNLLLTPEERQLAEYEKEKGNHPGIPFVWGVETEGELSFTDDKRDDEEEKEGEEISETGIYDEGFVYVSEAEEHDKFDTLLLNIPDDEGPYPGGELMTEPEAFDSIPLPDVKGNYAIHDYKAKLTPDLIGGGLNYDTFFGLIGSSFLAYTDHLGNHQLYIVTDVVNTIDQSNLQIFYFYNRKRTSFGIGFFHSKNFYQDFERNLFSDRFYGFEGMIRYPFTTFKRLEFVASHYFIDRKYVLYNSNDIEEAKTNTKTTTANLSYVVDNIIWGMTGPVNGRRAKLTLTSGINMFDVDKLQFSAVEFDYRKYWHFKKTASLAFRFSGGFSEGKTPKTYYLGGTSNWVVDRDYDSEIYDVNNLYFSGRITPLRGYDYFQFSGSRYALFNAELRFPLIDYFIMRFPLPIVLSQVKGALFTDIGAAWTGSNFKGGETVEFNSHLKDIKVGFGFGTRLNLGFLLFRYDAAWTTDLDAVSHRPTHYFSFGADF